MSGEEIGPVNSKEVIGDCDSGSFIGAINRMPMPIRVLLLYGIVPNKAEDSNGIQESDGVAMSEDRGTAQATDDQQSEPKVDFAADMAVELYKYHQSKKTLMDCARKWVEDMAAEFLASQGTKDEQ